MKKLLLTALFIAATALLSAHEFWLQPNKFIYKRGEEINIRFHVGENFYGDNWTGDTARVERLDFYYGGVTDDLLPAMGKGKGDSIRFALLDEGTAMISFNSRNSYITLDSGSFNAYLQEDGLTEAIKYRKQHREMDSSGHEYYQRSVKTILQVGKVIDTTFRQETGLPLDIIPQSNPYGIKNKQEVTVKILFNKQPLAGKLVKIWHRKKNKTTQEQYISNPDGEISFDVETTGEWMVSCVKMIRLNDPEVQWQSYWGSCTWGYSR